MTWTYSCPICESVVNPDETVILLASRGDSTILLGFHPQPGNYTVYVPRGCELRVGDAWDLYCPVCRGNLVTEEHEHICELHIWQGTEKRRILFSRVFGERATYLLGPDSVEGSFGDHRKNYEDTVPRFRFPEP